MPKGFINVCIPDDVIAVNASDGVRTYMHMRASTHPNPNYKVIDFFMISDAVVDHQMSSLRTIEHNDVEYFISRGSRIWVLTHRIGMNMWWPSDKWTTFDARLDILEALTYIRKTRGCRPIYTIGHCMWGVAFESGLLDGTIPANWTLGITASQVFMNPEWATLNIMKVSVQISLTGVYKLLGGNWFSVTGNEDDTLLQRGIEQLLRVLPCGAEGAVQFCGVP